MEGIACLHTQLSLDLTQMHRISTDDASWCFCLHALHSIHKKIIDHRKSRVDEMKHTQNQGSYTAEHPDSIS